MDGCRYFIDGWMFFFLKKKRHLSTIKKKDHVDIQEREHFFNSILSIIIAFRQTTKEQGLLQEIPSQVS